MSPPVASGPTATNSTGRAVPMRVIVCGLHRTGTMSMRAALWQLGFHDCYHMHTVMENLEDHPQQWMRALRAKHARDGSFTKSDWDALLSHSQACCDMPSALFGVELAHVYPDAKVVILNRDADAWYDSALNTVQNVLDPPSLLSRLVELYCYALDPMTASSVDFINAFFVEHMGYDLRKDRDGAIAWYKAQYQEFRDKIPPERCLEFRIQDGWKPLCEHLGVDIPLVRDERGELVVAPFPRLNDRGTFALNRGKYREQSLARANGRLFAMLGRVAVVGALAYGCDSAWTMLRSWS